MPVNQPICFGSWCYESPWPVLSGVRQITGRSPRDIWLVTDEGVIHGDGSRWSGIPDTSGTAQVWPLAEDDIWAAGTTGVRHFDGGTWREVYRPSGSGGVGAIWASSSSDVWAVGAAVPGTLAHFDGRAWTEPVVRRESDGEMVTITPQLYAVWGVRPGEIWAVGQQGNLVHCAGGACTQVAAPESWFLQSVWGAAPDDVWAVGNVVVHYDGKTWTVVETGTRFGYSSVAGSGRNDVWMAGSSDGSVLHWDGAGLTRVVLGTGGEYLYAAWVAGPGDVWIGGTHTLLHRTGGCFTSLQRTPAGRFTTAWASPSGEEVWAAGDAAIWHRTGSTWNALEGDALHGVADFWGTAKDDLWAVGGSIRHWDGSRWSDVPSGTNDSLVSISGTGPSDAWAISAAGSVVHWDGATWTQVSKQAGELQAVWAAGPGDVWLLAGKDVLRGDGVSFTPVHRLPYGGGALWGTGPGDVFAVGEVSQIIHFDGSSWVWPGIGHGGSAYRLYGVAGDGRPDGAAFAVGNYGQFYALRGGPAGGMPYLSHAVGLVDVAVTNSDIWAVGDGALIRVAR
jgi:hypothetical protein